MSISYYWNKILKKLRLSAVKNSSVHKSAKIGSGTTFINSSIDKYSFCGYDCKIVNAKLGAFCSLADNVVIGGASHPIDWVSSSPVFYVGKESAVKRKFSEFDREQDKITTIGNDVWIGDCAIIKAGVTVGDGAVIGMGSVVTKDVPPYAVVGGVPAKVIKYRFDEETVQSLLESRWWSLPDEELEKYAKSFNSPKDFLNEVSK